MRWIANNKCCECEYEWVCVAGTNPPGDTECPNCGSFYWVWTNYQQLVDAIRQRKAA